MLDFIRDEWNNKKILFLISPKAIDKKDYLVEKLKLKHQQNIHPVSGAWEDSRTREMFKEYMVALSSGAVDTIKETVGRLQHTSIV